MGFYRDWNGNRLSAFDSYDYIEKFLKASPETIHSLKFGDETELKSAYDVLNNTPIPEFLQCIEKIKELPELTPADVPCFSTMENGASRLNELLVFAPDGLTYSQIGYQLMNSVTDAAQKKYGENQSKLASQMTLVNISSAKPFIVKETAWGSYLTQYDFTEKKEIIKKLLLRNPCIQHLISGAILGNVSYSDVVYFLQRSTKIRRRTNVRYLINFILEDSENEILLSKFNWEV